ncbi:MAG: hypothetical protein OXC42_00700 [Gammaproteobacteria bacterium]|nr:hypothetical protein [Gammaproteobacteria bacterium]
MRKRDCIVETGRLYVLSTRMPREKLASTIGGLFVIYLTLPEISDSYGWWKTMLENTSVVDIFLYVVALCAIAYGTTDLWMGFFGQQSLLTTNQNKKPTERNEITGIHPVIQTHASDKEFLSTPIVEVFKELQALISIREKERAKLYIGKWLKVQNTIEDISQYRSDDSVNVTFAGDKCVSYVKMKFSDKQTCDVLKTMDKDERLAVVGEIVGITGYEVELENCELVDLNPNDDNLETFEV